MISLYFLEKVIIFYIINIEFWPVAGGLVVGEAGGLAVVASVGGWAVEGAEVART